MLKHFRFFYQPLRKILAYIKKKKPERREYLFGSGIYKKIVVMDTKKGKRSTSHRYNQIPLLRSRPGGF